MRLADEAGQVAKIAVIVHRVMGLYCSAKKAYI
jgi:hypothetical protein